MVKPTALIFILCGERSPLSRLLLHRSLANNAFASIIISERIEAGCNIEKTWIAAVYLYISEPLVQAICFQILPFKYWTSQFFLLRTDEWEIYVTCSICFVSLASPLPSAYAFATFIHDPQHIFHVICIPLFAVDFLCVSRWAMRKAHQITLKKWKIQSKNRQY